MPKIEKIRCKSCREPINLADQKNGRLKCPACGTVHKLQPQHIRPRWKAYRPQFLLAVGGAAVLIVLLLVLILSLVCCSGSPEETTPVTTEPVVTQEVLTPAQQDAVDLAKNYLDQAAFSYLGLVSQLEYDGIDYETADFAVARCGADWYLQAELSARSYLELGGFDRQTMIDTLLFEGFTNAEAAYGADAVGLMESYGDAEAELPPVEEGLPQ